MADPLTPTADPSDDEIRAAVLLQADQEKAYLEADPTDDDIAQAINWSGRVEKAQQIAGIDALFKASTFHNADRYNQTLELQNKLGTPREVVDANLDGFLKAAELVDWDAARFVRENPILAQKLFERPDAGPVILKKPELGLIGTLFSHIRESGRRVAAGDQGDSTTWLDGEELAKAEAQAERDIAKEQKRRDDPDPIPMVVDPGSKLQGVWDRLFGTGWGWGSQPAPVIDQGDATDTGQTFSPKVAPAWYSFASQAWKQQVTRSSLGRERMELVLRRDAEASQQVIDQGDATVVGQGDPKVLAELNRQIFEVDSQLAELRNQSTPREYGAGFVEKTLYEGINIVPSMSSVLVQGGVGGAIGAGLGALLPVPGGARMGWLAGTRLGSFRGSYNLERGGAYLDMLEQPLEDGSKMPEATAITTASLYGVLAAIVEVDALGKFVEMWGPLGDMVKAGQAVAFRNALLRDPTFRHMMADAGKRWVAGGYAEAREEVIQQLLQDASSYVARNATVHGGKFGAWQAPDSANAVAEYADIFASTFVGTLLVGAHGVTTSVAAQVNHAADLLVRDEAYAGSSKARAIADYVFHSKAAKSVPDVVADLIAKEGNVEKLYLDGLAFIRLFQTEGAKVQWESAARELGGDDFVDKIKAAAATGGKVAIPMGDFVANWAGKPIAQGIALDLAVNPGHLTTRQRIEQYSEIRKAADELYQRYLKDNPPPASEAEATMVGAIREQLGEQGKKFAEEDIAKGVATWRALLTTQAKRFGLPADDLFRDAAVRFRAGWSADVNKPMAAPPAAPAQAPEPAQELPAEDPNRFIPMRWDRGQGYTARDAAFEWTKQKAALAAKKIKEQQKAFKKGEIPYAPSLDTVEKVRAFREQQHDEQVAEERQRRADRWREMRRQLRSLPAADRRAVVEEYNARGEGQHDPENLVALLRKRLQHLAAGNTEAIAAQAEVDALQVEYRAAAAANKEAVGSNAPNKAEAGAAFMAVLKRLNEARARLERAQKYGIVWLEHKPARPELLSRVVIGTGADGKTYRYVEENPETQSGAKHLQIIGDTKEDSGSYGVESFEQAKALADQLAEGRFGRGVHDTRTAEGHRYFLDRIPAQNGQPEYWQGRFIRIEQWDKLAGIGTAEDPSSWGATMRWTGPTKEAVQAQVIAWLKASGQHEVDKAFRKAKEAYTAALADDTVTEAKRKKLKAALERAKRDVKKANKKAIDLGVEQQKKAAQEATQEAEQLVSDEARQKRLEAEYERWLLVKLGPAPGMPATPDEVTDTDRRDLWPDFIEDIRNTNPDLLEGPWGPAKDTLGVHYFASGSNHPGEIAGLSHAGYNVGVAVPELGRLASWALGGLKGTGTKVFVDSGAFSEVAFGPQGPVVESPITEEQWNERLDEYLKLGKQLGDQLYVVAPDMVAFQAQTLERLAKYAGRMQEIAATGANVIIPVQKGELDMVAFWEKAQAILGPGNWIAGIPSKKDATKTAELADFADRAKPARIHLLGMGPESPRFAEVVKAIRATNPQAEIFGDSVLVRRLAGKTNGPGGGPRRITARRDELIAAGMKPQHTALLKEATVQTALLDLARGDGKYSLATKELLAHLGAVTDARDAAVQQMRDGEEPDIKPELDAGGSSLQAVLASPTLSDDAKAVARMVARNGQVGLEGAALADQLANLSDGARAMADKVVEALKHEEGPEPGDETVPGMPPGRLTQVEREVGADGQVVKDDDGNYFAKWKAKVSAWMQAQGATPQQIREHLAAAEGQLKIFAALGARDLDLLPRNTPGDENALPQGKKTPGGPIRLNVDPIYRVSFDASAMCVKRLEAQATAALVQAKLKRTLTTAEKLALVALFREAGKAAPCVYCYVESPRMKAAEAVKKAMDIVFRGAPLSPKWKAPDKATARAAIAQAQELGLTPDDINPNYFTDPAILGDPAERSRAAKADKVYRFLQTQMVYAKANAAKLYAEYAGQVLDLDERTLRDLNRYAGFRIFSSSDFQGEHLADLIQLIADLDARQAKSHAYTKVEDFVRVFGGTGMKIQMSIFGTWENGKATEDTHQGMSWQTAQELRKKFPHVGTVLVATSDEMVEWGLKQKWVDYIIPFHMSGLEKKYFGEEGLGYTDYSSTQKEKVKHATKAVEVGARYTVGDKLYTNLRQAKTASKKAGLPVVTKKAPKHIELVKRGEVVEQYTAADAQRAAKELAAKKPGRRVEKVEDGTWRVIHKAISTGKEKVIGIFSVHTVAKAAEKAANKAKQIRMYEIPGVHDGIDDELAAQRYLAMCARRQLKPVFSKWAGEAGYFKLKKDYARTDKPFVQTSVRGVNRHAAEDVLARVMSGDIVVAKNVKGDQPIATKLHGLIEANDGEVVNLGQEGLHAMRQHKRIEETVRSRIVQLRKNPDYPAVPGLVTPEQAERLKQTDARLFQAAYQGGRVRNIERMSTDFVGTGQGALSFGWGLYFAENLEVAEDYRKQLAEGRSMEVRGQGRREAGPLHDLTFIALERELVLSQTAMQRRQRGQELDPDEVQAGIDYALRRNKDIRKNLQQRLDGQKAQLRQSLAPKVDWDRVLSGEEVRLERAIADHDRIIDDLTGLKASDITWHQGQVYKVDLPDKEKLLDWDERLDDQAPGVLEKLRRAGLIQSFEVVRDGERYNIVERIAGKTRIIASRFSNRADAERSLRGYSEGLGRSGEDFYRDLAKELGPNGTGDWEDMKAASMALQAAGLPGLKYLDQFSRRGYVYTLRLDGERVAKAPGLSEMQRDALTLLKARTEMQGPTGQDIPTAMASLRRTARKNPELLAWLDEIEPRLTLDATKTHNFVMWDDSSVLILDRLYQQAFQGGAANFDRHDISYVGTGEGSQYRGFGHYFAQVKDTADKYRNIAIGKRGYADGIDLGVPDEGRGREPYRVFAERLSMAVHEATGGPHGLGIIGRRADVGDFIRDLDEAARSWSPTFLFEVLTGIPLFPDGFSRDALQHKYTPEEIRRGVREWGDRLGVDLSALADGVKDGSGVVYTVEVPEDTELLHLDLTLDRQPEAVLAKLEAAGIIDRSEGVPPEYSGEVPFLRKKYGSPGLAGLEEVTGLDLMRGLEEAIAGYYGRLPGTFEAFVDNYLDTHPSPPRAKDGVTIRRDAVVASFFQSIGIPGNRFWDQWSRGKDEYVNKPFSEMQALLLPRLLAKAEELKTAEPELAKKLAFAAASVEVATGSGHIAQAIGLIVFGRQGWINGLNDFRGTSSAFTMLTGVQTDDLYTYSPKTHNYVIWDEDRIIIKEKNGQVVEPRVKQELLNERQDAPEPPRIKGWMDRLREGARRIFDVVFTEHADLSTFLHESSHIWLELMGDLAERADAPEQLKQDWAQTLAWLGAADRRGITQAMHEKWAGTFEAYFAKGEAPSSPLVRPFTRFSIWLKKIYGDLRAIPNAELDETISGIFDRLLATDAQIENMKKAMAVRPMWRSPQEAGMTGEEWQAYLDDIEKVTQHASMAMHQAVVRDRLRELEGWWQKEEENVRAQVEEEYDANPAASLYRFLKTGEGAEYDPALAALKNEQLDAAAVMEALKSYGPEVTKAAKSKLIGRMSANGKVRPDELAALFRKPDGTPAWESGGDMLRAIAALQTPRDKWVKEETARLMAEHHGDIAADKARLEEAAGKALHEKPTIDWLLREYELLRQRANVPVWNPETNRFESMPRSAVGAPAPIESIELAAKEIIEDTGLTELTASRFLQAERSAGEAAFEAVAKGDFAAALVAKQRQILNALLYTEALKARAERTAFAGLLKRSADVKQRGRLGKADPIFRDVADTLLEALGAKQPDLPEVVAQRADLDQLVERLDADGLAPAFDLDAIRQLLAKPPQPLLGRTGKPRPAWLSLSVSQMREADAALRQIRKAAADVLKVKLKGELVAIADVNVRIADEAGRLKDKGAQPASETAAPTFWAEHATLQNINAALTDPQFMFELLGPTAYQLFWRGYLEARDAQAKLTREVFEVFERMWQEVPIEDRKARFEKIDPQDLPLPPGLDRDANYRDVLWLIMVLANMGNASNRQRLLDGYGWTEAQVTRAIEKYLTHAQVEFVQKLWTLMETKLYPAMAEAHERTNGVKPKRIPPSPITLTIDGVTRTYAGGYWPAKYDPLSGKGTGQRQEAAGVQALYGGQTAYPTMQRAFTKERVKKFVDVVNLQWNVLPQHIFDVVHFTAFDSFVRDAFRVMRTPEFKNTVRHRLGEKYNDHLDLWLRVVATAEADTAIKALDGIHKGIGWSRSRFTMGILGASVQTMLGDIPAPLIAIMERDVKARYMLPACLEGATVIGWWNMRTFALRNSEELRHQAENWRQRLRVELGEVGKAGKRGPARRALEFVREMAWVGFDLVQRLTSTVVWTGAYRQAKAQGMSDADAAAYGDQVVQHGYPSRELAEQPTLIRDRNLGTALAFYSFFNKRYTGNRRIFHPAIQSMNDAEGVGGYVYAAGSVAVAAAYMLGNLLVYNVLSELLSGRGPEEDEHVAAWAARKALAGYFQQFPFGGEVAQLVENQLKPEDSRRQISERGAPVYAAVTAFSKALVKALDGDAETFDRLVALGEMGGYAFKLPVSQPKRTIKYLFEPSDKSIPGIISGTIYGERDEQPANPVNIWKR